VAEYYKFEIANWDEGTAMLTLEQEAAYLRVVNAIRLKDQPLTFNMFALCGIWRCNERRAKRLLEELIAAGKLRIEDGKIINDKAVDDASNLRRLRADRASAGSRGGIESAKSRAKSLENKGTAEAIASTREEKRREEKKEREANASPKKIGSRISTDWSLPSEWRDWAVGQGMSEAAAEAQAERFRDYWLGKTGKDGAKADWLATWRNWVRKALEDGRSSARPHGQPQHGEERQFADGTTRRFDQFMGWKIVH